ncbi:uncharacterized protein B0H18DRAFT_1117842 [Fomitopsis serialis]|uniref:uncharacterized protein n=1 Tax=Fomitopsis serialis TaxID=139415 RepID=UPI002008BB1C|nr:uncharacterized protein B0H18DRAFT_1117842 [Neoantrodia serialis]KAH9928649.1 hypothetical protein B0H18DRAFT_1117842 [Neoantrodia serialis]
MAGANYMGGKRNFARARAKDAAGKAQRNHFGKQRLGVLTKGLSKAHAEVPQSTDSGVNAVGKISLAHARRDFQKRSGDAPVSDDDDAPLLPPQRISGTPRATRRGPASDNASSVSSKSRSHTRSSKILKALDAFVPISLRAEMDRIRHIPNLAGLAPKPERRPHLADYEDADVITYSSSPDDAEPPRKKRRVSPNPGRELSSDTLRRSHIRSNSGTYVDEVMSDEGSDFTPLYVSEGYPPPAGTTKHQPEFVNQLDFDDLAHTEPDFEPMPLDSSPAMPRSFDDFGFSEFLPIPGPSPHKDEKTLAIMKTHQRYQPASYSAAGDESDDGIVQESIYDVLHGELFEGTDPWRALDTVLGLQPQEHSFKPRRSPRDHIPDDRHATERSAHFELTPLTLGQHGLDDRSEADEYVGMFDAASPPAELDPALSRRILASPGDTHENGVEDIECQPQDDVVPQSLRTFSPVDIFLPINLARVEQAEHSQSMDMDSGTRSPSYRDSNLSQDLVLSDIIRSGKVVSTLQSRSPEARAIAESSGPEMPVAVADNATLRPAALPQEDVAPGADPASIEGPCLFADELLSDED